MISTSRANSRGLIRMLGQSPGLRVLQVADEGEALRALRARDVFGIVTIPAKMQERLSRGEAVTVQWPTTPNSPPTPAP